MSVASSQLCGADWSADRECGHSTLMYLQTEAPRLAQNTATPPLQDVLRQWCSGEMNKVTAEFSGCYENSKKRPTRLGGIISCSLLRKVCSKKKKCTLKSLNSICCDGRHAKTPSCFYSLPESLEIAVGCSAMGLFHWGQPH